ncbi:hypothetical protein GCM10009753_03800 [Streptantibioticus ferralitis]
MDIALLLVPAAIIAKALSMSVKTVHRSREVERAWNSGLTAEARCLRTYTKFSGETPQLYHVYEFTTREGRTVRFDERGGPATRGKGTFATVHYTAEHPEKATAHPPGNARTTLGVGRTLGCSGGIIAFCVVFVIIALTR